MEKNTDPFAALEPLKPGHVWLVGAGPGDPGLLSLYALHALRQADVVVSDALVSPAVLALIPEKTERVAAGKRGGRPSPTQPDISQKLVALARANRRVVRLKGGDPLVFGRGGEEALALAAAGIPFRIVPGITAGIGALAYAGIPLTHRGINSAVTFVTGHMAGGKIPDDINWKALADGSPVIIFYMALSCLDEIIKRLTEAGRKGGEKVAIVSKATTPEQKVVMTTLSECAAAAAREAIEAPALLVVGDVVRLRHDLDWLTPAKK